MNLRSGNTLVKGQRMSFVDVVRQKFTIQVELHPLVADVKRLEFNMEQLGMDWLKGSFVGRVHDVEVIPILQQRLRDAGFPQCSVRHIRGNLVLISSPSTDLFCSSVTNGKRLAKWLEEIRPWNCTEEEEKFRNGAGSRYYSKTRHHNEPVQIKVNDHVFSVKVMEEMGSGFAWLKSNL
ncbi:hypothetical protein Ancab_024363 [Ancistrocladus abbreviatus]